MKLSKKKIGEHTTPMEREHYKAQIAKLTRMGNWTQRELAEEVGISLELVRKLLKEVDADYKAWTLDDRQTWVKKELLFLLDIRREIVAAWEISKKPSKKRVVKQVPPKECFKCHGLGKIGDTEKKVGQKACPYCKSGMIAVPPEITKTTEGRIPQAEYMRLLQDNDKAIRELLGLNEAVKLNITTNVLDWAALLTGKAATQLPPGESQEVIFPVDIDTFAGIPEGVKAIEAKKE